MASRYYSSVAALTTLSNGVSAGGTSFIVGSTSGFPVQTPFTLLIDEGTTSEEIVTVTAVAGLTLTVTRGEDGTVAVAHDPGARVRHAMTARDLRDSREHEAATTGVHGIADTAKVVTTDGTQTLTGKTLKAASGGSPALKVESASGQTANVLEVSTPNLATLAVDKDGIVRLGSVGSGVAIRHGKASDGSATSGLLEVHSGNGHPGVVLRSDKHPLSGEKKPLIVEKQLVEGGPYTEVASIDKDGNLTAAGLNGRPVPRILTGTLTRSAASGTVAEDFTNMPLTAAGFTGTPVITAVISGTSVQWKGWTLQVYAKSATSFNVVARGPATTAVTTLDIDWIAVQA